MTYEYGFDIALSCGGCDATAVGRLTNPRITTAHLAEGTLGYSKLTLTVPDGWIAFDTYTNVTYCPVCWEAILTPGIEVTA